MAFTIGKFGVAALLSLGVATIVVSRWENALDRNRLKLVLDQAEEVDEEEPELVLVAHEKAQSAH